MRDWLRYGSILFLNKFPISYTTPTRILLEHILYVGIGEV